MRDVHQVSSPEPTGTTIDCAVLVASCDSYCDLWKPFFTLFWRFWPDCPFPVFLGTECDEFDSPRVETLNAGKYEWSKRLRLHLERLDQNFVLLLLEDFFIDARVDNRLIQQGLIFLRNRGDSVLRLYPQPGPDVPFPAHPGIGRLVPGAPYRVSTQAAIWNREALLALLQNDESIWEFETNGTRRAHHIQGGFWSFYLPALSYTQVVERGQWFRSAARYYAGQGIGCDFRSRPIMSPATALKKAINRFLKNQVRGFFITPSNG